MNNEKKEKDKPSFYAILPASIRYDSNLTSTEKLLFAEITALTDFNGYCWATNEYFANLFNLSTSWVSKILKKMVEKKLIIVNYKRIEKNITKRLIIINCQDFKSKNNLLEILLKKNKKILKNKDKQAKGVEVDFNMGCSRVLGGVEVECKQNILNEHKKKSPSDKKNFEKPSLQKIKDFVSQNELLVLPELFFTYYENKNWMNRKKNIDWKQTIKIWHLREIQKKINEI